MICIHEKHSGRLVVVSPLHLQHIEEKRVRINGVERPVETTAYLTSGEGIEINEAAAAVGLLLDEELRRIHSGIARGAYNDP